MKTSKKIFLDFWGTLSYLEKDNDFVKRILETLKIENEEYDNLVKNIWYKKNISPTHFAEDLVKIFGSNQYHIKKLSTLLKTPIKRVRLYPDVIENLERLSKNHPLFLISDTSSVGKMSVKKTGLERYFNKMFFSCDYGIRKSEGLYNKVFLELKLITKECLVIGNSYNSDYKIPISLGANAILIDRQRKNPNITSINNLKEIK